MSSAGLTKPWTSSAASSPDPRVSRPRASRVALSRLACRALTPGVSRYRAGRVALMLGAPGLPCRGQAWKVVIRAFEVPVAGWVRSAGSRPLDGLSAHAVTGAENRDDVMNRPNVSQRVSADREQVGISARDQPTFTLGKPASVRSG